MPRRAEFIFYQTIGRGLSSHGLSFNAPKGWIHFLSFWNHHLRCWDKSVSMPRRAEFIFYLTMSNTLLNVLSMFQCPEGLNSFSIERVHNRFSYWKEVSMPRRAEFIFYRSCTPILPNSSIRFNAPKGWIHFLSGIEPDAPLESKDHPFQCPEGLNSFSIIATVIYHSPVDLGISFNAPKGWIHFLSDINPGEGGHRPRLCFNAPKGWIHFLSRGRGPKSPQWLE